ncbi:hypothetical protein BJ684DRAFT_21407 [Piptocephalis cylindrospora]|uniref:Uncharacterized protein n=1 Tax=Piptocephalis cylindrospora TaxID=1907219 RepID=A0A4P9XZU2_9FUNG|nr:hypothetical protein BJ684DRAFT_21407 [Piptocephalis cylindrospora]|eukprot:RKP12026.1 hypothetical protein BJ684DRAFT_21407 [Piptocephalis cylindrospora]
MTLDSSSLALCQAHWTQLSTLLSQLVRLRRRSSQPPLLATLPAQKSEILDRIKGQGHGEEEGIQRQRVEAQVMEHLGKIKELLVEEATAREGERMGEWALADPFLHDDDDDRGRNGGTENVPDKYISLPQSRYPCLHYLLQEGIFEVLGEWTDVWRIRRPLLSLLSSLLALLSPTDALPIFRSTLSRVCRSSHLYSPCRSLCGGEDGEEEEEEEEGEGEEDRDEGEERRKEDEGTDLLLLIRLCVDLVGERPSLASMLFDGECGFYPADMAMARVVSRCDRHRSLASDILLECIGLGLKHPRVLSHLTERSRFAERMNDLLLELLAKVSEDPGPHPPHQYPLEERGPEEDWVTCLDRPLRSLPSTSPTIQALRDRVLHILRDGAFLFLSDSLINGKEALSGDISVKGVLWTVSLLLRQYPGEEVGPLEKALLEGMILDARFHQDYLASYLLEGKGEIPLASLQLLLTILQLREERSMEMLLFRELRPESREDQGSVYEGMISRILGIMPFGTDKHVDLGSHYALRASLRYKRACEARRAWLLGAWGGDSLIQVKVIVQ